MITLINNYTSKYWLKDEIIDCGNNLFDDNFKLSMNNEKLKDYYDNNINLENLNDQSDTIRNTNYSSRNRKDKQTNKNNRSEFNRNKNKNNGITTSKKTNKYINFQRTDNTDNNKKKMYSMSSCCRISEYKGRNILLDSCPKSLEKIT
jgi:hypothetical protein